MSGLLVVGSPAMAQTDPVEDAEAAVADARAVADRAAGTYLDLLSRSETLLVEMEETEQRLEELRAKADELRAKLRDRAALAYLRSGSTDIDFGLGNDEEGIEVARRHALLDRLNESDNEVAEELAGLTKSLESRRDQLKADRAAYDHTLELLRDEQEQLDAKLAQAQAAHTAALAEQAAAEQEAAEREAAEQEAAEQEAAEQQAAEQEAAAPAPTAAPAPAPATTPKAPTPPLDYTPTPGEHPRHSDPFLTCTRAVESGGNYQAYNPSGPWYGAYQFLQSTWNSTANHAGRPELIGLDPRNASEYDQDDMAWALYQWKGKGPWGGRC